MQAVNILCVKWGNKYGPEYVNKLFSMVSRHLSLPFRFICLTDNPEGIKPGIDVKPIPSVGFEDFDLRKPWSLNHGWLKVTSFAKPLHDITGPTLFLDLDVVIVDNIDCFFEPAGEFRVIKEWDKRDYTGNTSVYRFASGAHPDVIENLKFNKPNILQRVRNEQEYVTGYLARQGKLHYWSEDWCVSFKRHCLPRLFMNWFKPAVIPRGAKIVVFHGKPNPPDAIKGYSGKWYRRVLPVQWVASAWQ
ncbi:MAG TPA: glycosyltransferase [Cellvibrionaceae bacterium]